MRTSGEWNAGFSHDSRDCQCVADHLSDGLVALHRCDHHEIDLGITVGQDHRDRIVVPGVALQNDRVRTPVKLVAVATR